ncbi:hypothetical protein ABLV98_15460 [Staphylococcus sp. 50Mo3-1]|uniref:hypothetical protein n=1 Tax=Staphylococcus sp. 50Mo3-2 TaxID=3135642 RepID=UPI0033E269D1
MDKDIMNYLDKVGQYLQGAGEKGFETYVHGVWVTSLIYTLIGVLLLALIPVVYILASRSIEKVEKVKSYLDDSDTAISVIAWAIMFGCFIVGTSLTIFNITGIFAPDYVAIKEIAENIGGK